jgi:hypothetical protein
VTDKVDLKKLDGYRARAGEFRILELPPTQYLVVDGHGDPNTAPYRDAIEQLYPVAYRLKFASKAAGRDYVVPPLEALWSAPDMSAFTTARDKSAWDWTLLMMVPDWITADDFRAAEPSADIGFATLEEGRCVQTLHLGPFDDEGPTLAQMHDEFIPEQGFRMSGRHHEIYLSDLRRVEPSKLRTILRQPVASA